MEPKFKVGDKVVYTGWGDITSSPLVIGWVIEGNGWYLYQLVADDGVSVGYAELTSVNWRRQNEPHTC